MTHSPFGIWEQPHNISLSPKIILTQMALVPGCAALDFIVPGLGITTLVGVSAAAILANSIKRKRGIANGRKPTADESQEHHEHKDSAEKEQEQYDDEQANLREQVFKELLVEDLAPNSKYFCLPLILSGTAGYDKTAIRKLVDRAWELGQEDLNGEMSVRFWKVNAHTLL